MKYYVCEHNDTCKKGDCILMLPRKFQNRAGHCPVLADNVADKELDGHEVRALIEAFYPELFPPHT